MRDPGSSEQPNVTNVTARFFAVVSSPTNPLLQCISTPRKQIPTSTLVSIDPHKPWTSSTQRPFRSAVEMAKHGVEIGGNHDDSDCLGKSDPLVWWATPPPHGQATGFRRPRHCIWPGPQPRAGRDGQDRFQLRTSCQVGQSGRGRKLSWLGGVDRLIDPAATGVWREVRSSGPLVAQRINNTGVLQAASTRVAVDPITTLAMAL